jgi:Putative peptidoglycan binding domain/Penicillin-insensitive murein endopeptidase
MPRILRKDFLETRLPKQLDLNAARNDPAFLAQLRAAGLKPEDLDKLDLYGHDGMVRGPRELRALFDFLKSLEAGGPSDALGVSENPRVPKKVDQVFNAIESRFEVSPRPPAGLPTLDGATQRRFPLSAAVGRGMPNRPEDVRLLQARLKELGFNLGVDGQFGGGTERALQVFRAMLTGDEEVAEEPGRIAPNDLLHVALTMEHPPQWVEMPRSGTGFVNADTDRFGHGSEESKLLVEEAGVAYARDHLANHPGAAPLHLNDVSKKEGGKTRDHETHQTGLDLDFRLPRKDGTAGTEVRRSDYDRETTWAMLKALASNPRVERVLFSDPVLAERAKTNNEPWAFKLFDGGPIHKNHIHVDVKPPVVVPES